MNLTFNVTLTGNQNNQTINEQFELLADVNKYVNQIHYRSKLLSDYNTVCGLRYEVYELSKGKVNNYML